MMSALFEGYGAANRIRLGSFPEARIVWTQLHDAMDAAIDEPRTPVPLTSFWQFLNTR